MTPRTYRNQKGIPTLFADSFYGLYDTAFGKITIACSDSAIVAVQFGNKMPCGMKEQRTELTDKAAFQINEYFSGRRRSFDIPLAPQGTLFQRNVWDALCRIPYGETRSYKEIAKTIGNPNASRAVGMANNKNSILLLIPCHRVIGENGSLVGYAGGLDIKEKLLNVVETEFNGTRSICCGDDFYQMLPLEEVHRQMKKRADSMPCDEVCVYCISCIKSMHIGGKQPRHLIDLLMGETTEPQVYDTVQWHKQLQDYIDEH